MLAVLVTPSVYKAGTTSQSQGPFVGDETEYCPVLKQGQRILKHLTKYDTALIFQLTVFLAVKFFSTGRISLELSNNAKTAYWSITLYHI